MLHTTTQEDTAVHTNNVQQHNTALSPNSIVHQHTFNTPVSIAPNVCILGCMQLGCLSHVFSPLTLPAHDDLACMRYMMRVCTLCAMLCCRTLPVLTDGLTGARSTSHVAKVQCIARCVVSSRTRCQSMLVFKHQQQAHVAHSFAHHLTHHRTVCMAIDIKQHEHPATSMLTTLPVCHRLHSPLGSCGTAFRTHCP